MSKQALYRTLRPKTFDGVIGQEHITDVLKKQVEKSAPSHAYLFYGPRGSGKTSSSRILANALNCLNPKDGSPCGECEVCKACASGAFVDIIEMDAASNSSVEDVREMLEKVPLLPTVGKYKVYIIDEVHMFSKSAFNALLKTLEEPPAHAVFIFATTELSKVPKTIFSRTQKYGFKRLTNETIERYISQVLDDMGIKYEQTAVGRLAVFADGALRDALSLLDQLIANGDVTGEAVTKILGIPSEEAARDLCGYIVNENIKEAVALTNNLLNDGISESEILTGCSSALTDMLVKNADNPAERGKILSAIWALNDAAGLIKYTNVPSAVTLAAIVQAAQSYANPVNKNLALEVKHLNAQIAELKEHGPIEQRIDTDSDQNGELYARVEKLESRLTKAAQSYAALNSKYEKLKAETMELSSKLSRGAGAFSSPEPSDLKPNADYIGGEIKLNTYDPVEAGSLLYPTQKEQLRALKEIALGKEPMLVPALNLIKKLDTKDKKLLLYVNKADMNMMRILSHENYKPAVDDIITEIYGELLEVGLEEFKDGEDSPEVIAQFLNEQGIEAEIVDPPQNRN